MIYAGDTPVPVISIPKDTIPDDTALTSRTEPLIEAVIEAVDVEAFINSNIPCFVVVVPKVADDVRKDVAAEKTPTGMDK